MPLILIKLKDNSDPQYRSFRGNLFNLTALAISHLVLSHGYALLVSRMGSRAAGKRSDNLHRIPFMAIFAVILTLFLHGSSALKVFLIIAINFTAAKRLAGSRIGNLAVWIVNLVILFGNEIYDGYSYSSIHPTFAFLVGYTIPGFQVSYLFIGWVSRNLS
jgi:hypothetical protein